jgi:hypothetical protein
VRPRLTSINAKGLVDADEVVAFAGASAPQRMITLRHYDLARDET